MEFYFKGRYFKKKKKIEQRKEMLLLGGIPVKAFLVITAATFTSIFWFIVILSFFLDFKIDFVVFKIIIFSLKI